MLPHTRAHTIQCLMIYQLFTRIPKWKYRLCIYNEEIDRSCRILRMLLNLTPQRNIRMEYNETFQVVCKRFGGVIMITSAKYFKDNQIDRKFIV